MRVTKSLIRPWFVFTTIALLLGCEEKHDAVVTPSVFRWKNSHYLEGEEYQALEKHAITRVYHKLLDIDWNPAHGAHPISVVPIPYQWRNYYQQQGDWTGRFELVPCIYITNNTFTKINDKETDELASKLLRKLRMELPTTVQGVLLDCDWTPSTKARFFRLVRIMNDSLDVPLTATIRLHQFAHPGKTGVPPADRGMLMPYNVGQLKDPGDVNSIFDRELAEPYFANAKSYPLPLDIALPAFSWGAHFRQGWFMGILQEEELGIALENGMLVGERYGSMQVTREDNERMPQLHVGDMVRVERMSPEVIAEVVELASKAVNTDTMAVAYFELGANTFQQLDAVSVRKAFEWFGPVRFGPSPVIEPTEEDTQIESPAADSTMPFDPVPVDIPEIQRPHIKP